MRNIISIDDMSTYYFHEMENMRCRLETESVKENKFLRTCEIVDMSGLGMQHFGSGTKSFATRIFDFCQENYPDVLGRVFFINTPWLFQTAWSVVCTWITPETIAKVQVLGSDYKDTLKKFIDPSNLPQMYGGTCQCVGGCVEVIGVDDGFTTVTIKRGEKFQTELVVEKGALVTWDFRTRDNDISFEVSFVSNGNKATVEVTKRYESHLKPITAGFNAKEAGKVIFLWDNSYSRFKQKILTFLVQASVVEEKEQKDNNRNEKTSDGPIQNDNKDNGPHQNENKDNGPHQNENKDNDGPKQNENNSRQQ